MRNGIDPIQSRISSNGGYRNNFGAIIFPESKGQSELKKSKEDYQKMNKELEDKLNRVDELIEQLEKHSE